MLVRNGENQYGFVSALLLRAGNQVAAVTANADLLDPDRLNAVISALGLE